MPDPLPPELPDRPRGFWWGSIAGIAALSVVLQARIFDRTAVPMDEGQLAVIATRILDGEVLYRDVHTGIGPGIYHFAATLFAVFGRDLVVLRCAQVAVNAAIAVLLWLVAARIVRWHWAILAPLAFLLLVTVAFPVLAMLNYSSVALATALASLLVFQLYLDGGRVSTGVLLGGLLAITALTKQNYGVLVIIALFAALVMNRPDSSLKERSLAASLLPIVASGGVIALGMSVWFLAHGALGDLIRATLIDLGSPQLEAFDNPIPSIFGALPIDDPRFTFLYTPPTLFNHLMHGGKLFGQPITPVVREIAIRSSYGIPIACIVLAPAVLWVTRMGRDERRRREANATATFSAIFFLGIFPSAIWSHLAFVMPPTFLVLALLLDRCEDAVRRRVDWARPVAMGTAGVLAVVCLWGANRIGHTIQGWFPAPLDVPHATLFVTQDQAALYRSAVDFVEECAGPDEPIFVAPDIPIVYFITGRPNPTPYELTIPGNVDGRTIIQRLENSGTRCVVYNPRMYPEFPRFEALFPDLSRYLRTRYRQAGVIAGETTQWHGLVRRMPSQP